MAGTYGGSITLASVSDGSSGQTLYTWIRYAEDAQGTGISPSPTSTTKYIGFAYNKQSSTPSSNPSDYTWSEYVGQDGEDGEDGRGIQSTSVMYAEGTSGTTAPTSGWQSTVPSISQGKYLWTRTTITYTDSTTNVSYSVSRFGEDGEGIVYTIYTAHEKIYKFYSTTNQSMTYSPNELNFWATKIENQVETRLDPTSEYDSDLSIAGYTNIFGHLWSFLNRLRGYISSKSAEPEVVSMLNVARVFNADDSITFDFDNLFGYLVTDEYNTESDVELFNTLCQILQNENIYFILKIYTYRSGALEPLSGDLLSMKVLPFEYGTSNDMAKFALTASDIQMAVNDSKLVFSTDGLTVKNGGLRIEGADGKTLLEYSNNQQELTIVGNGTFTGTVNAEAGSFTGNVSADTLIANDGEIGGWILKSTGLYSKGGSTQTEEGWNTDTSYITLNGQQGIINAEYINLGVGAHLNNYLQLGEACLYNPNENNGKLLSAGAVQVKQNGEMTLGSISMDGPNSRIYGTNFSITPDTASFQNINASGKISTVVFESNHLQSVGGSMIFKPSYKIVEQNANTLTLDEEFQGNEGDYVYIINANGNTLPGLSQIGIVRGNQVTISTSIQSSEQLISLVDLGSYADLIVGINSNDGATGYLHPRGMTISEFSISGDGLLALETEGGSTYVDVCVQSEDGTSSLFSSDGRINTDSNPKVFLGDLDGAGIEFSGDTITKKGFGLYSENVYLTGSLTTKVQTGSTATYAGVNTLNSASATKFTDLDDTSKIVFWAGSASTANEDIQESPFQITEQGSLYAAQGLFEGAIITRSRIEGADIYAARIHGYLNNQANSLTFYDAAQGIVFRQGDWDGTGTDTSTEVFSIGIGGLRANGSYFIQIDDDYKVTFNGDAITIPEYFTDKTQSMFLHLNQNKVLGSSLGDNDLEVVRGNLSFNADRLGLGIGENGTQMELKEEEIDLNTSVVKMYNTILYEDKLKYEKVSTGYNLYVM